MVVGDKAKLEKEFELSNLVKKYIFTFKDEEDTKGTVFLYDRNGESQEYEFEREFIKFETPVFITGNIKLDRCSRMTIKKDEGDDCFFITSSQLPIQEQRDVTRNSPKPFYFFIKDLTEQYKAEYPSMEHAYSIQAVSY